MIESQEQLMDVYERLDDMNADTAESRAAYILHGLGFTPDMQIQKTKDFSGELFCILYVFILCFIAIKFA